MGLYSEIDGEIAKAFANELKDAVKDFTAQRISLSNDDWTLNGADVADSLNYGGKGVFTGYLTHEIDNQSIKQHDVKLICLQSQIDKTPLIDDVIDGKKVMNVKQDAAKVSYTIQLRGFDDLG
ncbi:glutamate 5-kinase [Moraxella sp. ZJ142]|uniref:glutamate 5-kinase n=1 Tax=Moraxella marmotae TaxID=3344520 RepID=UPI0035D47450